MASTGDRLEDSPGSVGVQQVVYAPTAVGEGEKRPLLHSRPEDVPAWDSSKSFFTKIPKAGGAPNRGRVGVPGHPSYDFYRPDSALAPRTVGGGGGAAVSGWVGSIWQLVFLKRLFWVHMFCFGLFILLNILFYDSIWMREAMAYSAIESRLHSVAIFTVTFYSANVFGIFRARMDETLKTNGSISALCGMIPPVIDWSYEKARSLLRYANSMMHLNYACMSGPMNDIKWQMMLSRGLLTEEEQNILMAAGGDYSTIVHTWAVKVARDATKAGAITVSELSAFLLHLGTIRGLSAKQIGRQLLQIPKPYYHVMSLCIQIFVICVGYGSAHMFGQSLGGACLEDMSMYQGPVTGNPCLAGGILTLFSGWWLMFIMLALYQVAVHLSDPMGNGPTDYDLSVDLEALWRNSLRMLNSYATCGFPSLAASPP